MKRISTSTAVSNRFVDGNKITGLKATQFNAEWCNQVQEEICNLIKALTGSDLTGASEHELSDAIKAFGGNSDTPLAERTFTFSKSGETYSLTISRSGISITSTGGGMEISALTLKIAGNSSDPAINIKNGRQIKLEGTSGSTQTNTISDNGMSISSQGGGTSVYTSGVKTSGTVEADGELKGASVSLSDGSHSGKLFLNSTGKMSAANANGTAGIPMMASRFIASVGGLSNSDANSGIRYVSSNIDLDNDLSSINEIGSILIVCNGGAASITVSVNSTSFSTTLASGHAKAFVYTNSDWMPLD